MKWLTGVRIHPWTPQLDEHDEVDLLTNPYDVILSCDRALHAHDLQSSARHPVTVNVIEMSEPSTDDREVSEQGCKAQITHVIFDCDGLMLGRLAKLHIYHLTSLMDCPCITRQQDG